MLMVAFTDDNCIGYKKYCTCYQQISANSAGLSLAHYNSNTGSVLGYPVVDICIQKLTIILHVQSRGVDWIFAWLEGRFHGEKHSLRIDLTNLDVVWEGTYTRTCMCFSTGYYEHLTS